MSKYDLLLSPFKLGNLTLKNRMVSAPTSLAEMGPGGVFSPENIAYYELRAKGGAAIVTVSEDEIAAGTVTCKDMALGEQNTLPLAELIPQLKAGLAEKNAGAVICEK